jgi:hypothetical protein
MTTPFSNSFATGTLHSFVIRDDTTGFLTFAYTFAQTLTSPQPGQFPEAQSLTVTGFAGVTTDAQTLQLNSAATVRRSDATDAGDVLTYSGNLFSQDVAPNSVFVTTNATAFSTGGTGAFNVFIEPNGGGYTATVAAFRPAAAAAIPIPPAVLLGGVGLLGIPLIRSRWKADN